jgi:hypothetical protein
MIINIYYQMSNPSICIPRVNKNITRKFICDIINKHNFGEIKKIDMVKMKKGFKVFIHFKYWSNNIKSLKVRKILASGQDFKIMYAEPWFWKCMNVY